MSGSTQEFEDLPYFSGIPSFCTANRLVIEACLEQAGQRGRQALIEATANQVNQFGGYTGMRPADFRDFVYERADRVGYPRERIILGGDHLGPLTWSDEPEASAMAKAEELVRQYVMAGYEKIHLDTSMRLGDDDKNAPLSDETIARRGARLYIACQQSYEALCAAAAGAGRGMPRHPLFVIGSEVPIPGGAQEKLEGLQVTAPEALDKTMAAYEKAFSDAGIREGLRYVIGVVVQPGVEFGDDSVIAFDPLKAHALSSRARAIKNVTLEGHSTDYQLPEDLKNMAASGITILKVGPALTFALREAMFSLELMEEQLIPPERQSGFSRTLERVMLERPKDWIKHYHGSPEEQRRKRAFSLSDRCRYYLDDPDVQRAMDKLMENIDAAEIPLGMLHQYMPEQCMDIRRGRYALSAEALVKSAVMRVADEYYSAF